MTSKATSKTTRRAVRDRVVELVRVRAADLVPNPATPEPEALASLLARVDASSAAVRDLLDSVAPGAGLPVARMLRDPDHVPASPPVVTKPGDLWVLGRHRLLCADATEPRSLARV